MIDVVSLEDAKRLKEQGYSKPCEYYYLDVDLPFCQKGLKKTKNGEKINHNAYDDFIYSAPNCVDAMDFYIGNNIQYESSVIFKFDKKNNHEKYK